MKYLPSPGAAPLTKKPEDSGYEIAYKTEAVSIAPAQKSIQNRRAIFLGDSMGSRKHGFRLNKLYYIYLKYS